MKERERSIKFGIRGKLIGAFLAVILISTVLMGYIGLGSIRSADESAVNITTEKLTSKAETDLTFLASDQAQTANDFCSEIIGDCTGSALYAYDEFTDPALENYTYTGDLYANFGFSDWKTYANKSRIDGVLNGSISDPLYNELLALCDNANDTKLNDVLGALAAGTYGTA